MKITKKMVVSIFIMMIALLFVSCPPQRSPEFIFNGTKGDIVIEIFYEFPQNDTNGDGDNWMQSWHEPGYYSIKVERGFFFQEIIRTFPESGRAKAERKGYTVTILLPVKKCICVDEGIDSNWKEKARGCRVIKSDNTSFSYDRSIRENSNYEVFLTNGNSPLENEVGKVITIK